MIVHNTHYKYSPTILKNPDLRSSLKAILKAFPLHSKLKSHAFQRAGIEFYYYLQSVINWNFKSAVLKSEVIAYVVVDDNGQLDTEEAQQKKKHIKFGRHSEGSLSKRKAPQCSVFSTSKENDSTPLLQSRSLLAHKFRKFLGMSESKIDSDNYFKPVNSNLTDDVAFNTQKTYIPSTHQSSDISETGEAHSINKTINYSDNAPQPTYGQYSPTRKQIQCSLVVAVKFVNANIGTSDNDEFCINRNDIPTAISESFLLSQLDHPSIPKYYESFSVSPSYCIIVQEYLVGSIQRLHQEFGPFPEWIIAFVLKDILSALEYLHNGPASLQYATVIHRDVKPANILLDDLARTKLIDFGASAVIPKDCKARGFVGTPQWMAPEVINPEFGGVNTSADIWSLGMTAIELATGRLPSVEESFNGSNSTLSLKEIVHRIGYDSRFEPILEDGVYPLNYLSKREMYATAPIVKTTFSLPTEKIKKAQSKEVTEPGFNDTTPSLNTIYLEFSDHFKDFVSCCIKRTPEKRSTALELLSHPFVTRDIRRPTSYKELFIELNKEAAQRKKMGRIIPVIQPHSKPAPFAFTNKSLTTGCNRRAQSDSSSVSFSPKLNSASMVAQISNLLDETEEICSLDINTNKPDFNDNNTNPVSSSPSFFENESNYDTSWMSTFAVRFDPFLRFLKVTEDKVSDTSKPVFWQNQFSQVKTLLLPRKTIVANETLSQQKNNNYLSNSMVFKNKLLTRPAFSATRTQPPKSETTMAESSSSSSCGGCYDMLPLHEGRYVLDLQEMLMQPKIENNNVELNQKDIRLAYAKPPRCTRLDDKDNENTQKNKSVILWAESLESKVKITLHEDT